MGIKRPVSGGTTPVSPGADKLRECAPGFGALRRLNWLCLAWLIGWLGCLGGPAWADEPARPITLRQAQFQRLDLAADAAWQPVALPDTWAARRLPQSSSAHYRLNFFLPAAPMEAVWALQLDRLSTTHTLRVNGVLVNHQRGGDGGKDDVVRLATSGKPTPVPAEFPSQLLHQGDNQIDIEWRLITRAGMSGVTVGPAIGLLWLLV